MAKKPYRRRNFFIKKDFQGRFIFRYFLICFGGVLIFALIFSYLSLDNLTITYDGQQLQLGKTPVVLMRELVEAHWFFLVIVGTMIAGISMLLTHRVAGPLFRFEKTFEAIAARDLSQVIVLRTKDEAKDTAATINTATERLSSDLQHLKSYSDELGETLQRLQEGDGNSSEHVRQAIEQNRKINQLLGEYRLRP